MQGPCRSLTYVHTCTYKSGHGSQPTLRLITIRRNPPPLLHQPTVLSNFTGPPIDNLLTKWGTIWLGKNEWILLRRPKELLQKVQIEFGGLRSFIEGKFDHASWSWPKVFVPVVLSFPCLHTLSGLIYSDRHILFEMIHEGIFKLHDWINQV